MVWFKGKSKDGIDVYADISECPALAVESSLCPHDAGVGGSSSPVATHSSCSRRDEDRGRQRFHSRGEARAENSLEIKALRAPSKQTSQLPALNGERRSFL